MALRDKIVDIYSNQIVDIISGNKFNIVDNVYLLQAEIVDEITSMKKKQIKMIKKEEAGTRNSMLYFEILNETKNLVLYMANVLKAQREFVRYNEGKVN